MIGAMRQAAAMSMKARLWKNDGKLRVVDLRPEDEKIPPDGTASPNVRFGSEADINADAEKGPLSGVKRTFPL